MVGERADSREGIAVGRILADKRTARTGSGINCYRVAYRVGISPGYRSPLFNGNTGRSKAEVADNNGAGSSCW